MGSSSAAGELRLPASDVTGSEPRHRAVRDEDPWFRPGAASRDYIDSSRPERDPLYRGMLGGITNWPDDGLTLPGVVTPPVGGDPLAEVNPDVVPAHLGGALESAPHNDSPGPSSGEKAVDNAIKEPAGAIAGAPSPATESSEDKGNADLGDGPSLGAKERAHHRVTLPHHIAGVLGTTRGKWAVAAIGVTIALMALGVVLAVHSHQSRAAAVQQAGDDSPVATGPAASYPAPPYAHATPSDPAQDTTSPRRYDSDAAATDPSPSAGAPLHGMSPNDPAPPDLPSDDPLTPSTPMPLDPAPSDPELNQTQPVGPAQTQVTPTQGRNGLASPQGRPDDRATTPRNPSPLSNSLDSITAPHRPGNSDRGDSDSQGRSKSVGGDLPGLGRGL
jgi:hypothetical protein